MNLASENRNLGEEKAGDLKPGSSARSPRLHARAAADLVVVPQYHRSGVHKGQVYYSAWQAEVWDRGAKRRPVESSENEGAQLSSELESDGAMVVDY